MTNNNMEFSTTKNIPSCFHGITTDKIRLLEHKSIYSVDMNDYVENTIKIGSTGIDFQQMKPKERIIHHEISGKAWDIIKADMFSLNSKHNL